MEKGRKGSQTCYYNEPTNSSSSGFMPTEQLLFYYNQTFNIKFYKELLTNQHKYFNLLEYFPLWINKLMFWVQTLAFFNLVDVNRSPQPSHTIADFLQVIPINTLVFQNKYQ